MADTVELVDLVSINDWIQARLESKGNHSDPEISIKETKELLRKFIRGKIVALKDHLGRDRITCQAVTVRTSFRETQEYLRPDYSFPRKLSELLVEPAFQRPFSFDFCPEADQPFSNCMLVEPHIKADLPKTFAALHRVRGDLEQEDSQNRNANLYFSARINSFWEQLAHSEIKEVRDRYIKPGSPDSEVFCIFAAQNSNTSENVVKPRHIVAIYFLSEPDFLEKAQGNGLMKDILETADQLFNGLTLIEKIDSALFQLEGLQLVAKLLPHFSNSDLSTADKVSLSIEEFKKVLAGHIVGRTFEGKVPDVFYISTAFEKTSEGKFFPKLSLYPIALRIDHSLAASQIAHRQIASISKLLLKQYLDFHKDRIVFGKSEEEEFALDENFVNVLDPSLLGCPDFSNWLHHVWQKDKPDLMHMVEHDTKLKDLDSSLVTPWEAFNKPSDPSKKNKSIVAYVVEGEPNHSSQNNKTLPRGIIAIESSNVAAFSDSDIEGLRAVLSGLSSLIRSVTHPNSPLDYRHQVKQAFRRYVPSSKPKVLSSEHALSLVFLAHTLDAKEAKKTCDAIRKQSKNPKVKDTEYLANSFRLDDKSLSLAATIVSRLQPVDDETLSDQQAARHIEKRVRSTQDFIASLRDTEGLALALEFLESCTENFLWANYFYSFGQALGDRVNTDVPNFHFMRPGYSASQMFMAVVKDELKQVIKLAEKKKLDTERDRYLRHVRYKVVNAARIPVTAYAFDSDGSKGIAMSRGGDLSKGKFRKSFGVLVSDLISSRGGEKEEVSTLISSVVAYLTSHTPGVKHEGKKPTHVSTLKTKVIALLGPSLELWRNTKYPLAADTLTELVRLAFRLPDWCDFSERPPKEQLNSVDPVVKRDAERRAHLIDTYEKFEEFCRNAGDVGVGLRDFWDAETLSNSDSDANLIKDLASITHGDLNARNLAWSEDLKSFFLIDFEHVGASITGTDHSRLAINLVTELFGAFLDKTGPSGPTTSINQRQIPYITKEIDTVLEHLPGLIRDLTQGGSTPTAVHVTEFAPNNGKRPEVGSVVWWLIGAILKELPTDVGLKNQDAVETHNYLWGYCLFCSCLKEFEYSLRLLNEDDLDGVLRQARRKSMNLFSMSATDLFEFLWDAENTENNLPKDVLGRIFRYFVAGRLLYEVVRNGK